MKLLNAIRMGGAEILPLVEGGKGVSISNGITSGHWAAAGGIGTFSAVNADSFDAAGRRIPQTYHGRTRTERHEELVAYAIKGALTQARRAYELASGAGRIHANILWEMGAAERIITEVLEQARGIIAGITCGAGMPYRLSDIAARFGVYYYPIISSARAFNALWKRAYHKTAELLGGVVYEDPWLAGGHNGLSNSEDPTQPENPYPRVVALRKVMREYGLHETPIIMAGGVWWLDEWEDWIDNPELGPVAFQFGTRPLLTRESPVSEAWKKKLLTLNAGDVFLNRFSPTGFYSSAVNNGFIQELRERNERQVAYSPEPIGEHVAEYGVGPRKRPVYLTPADLDQVRGWEAQGFTEAMRTPDSSLIFVTPAKAREITADQIGCMGCLSQCRFSNWSQHEAEHTTGKRPDPRSFCIQKTLQDIAHDDTPETVEHNLMFSGHNGFRFARDPFYSNGFIPTVKQLVERILTGR
ncbi:MAG: NAD(P)H-dependent flavin oxidoreductase [Acetobacteraceae bacterium]